MSRTDRIKWILAIVVGVIIAALVAVALLFGNGAITVIAPAGASISVVADGVELGTVAAGKHGRFNLEQGKHTVTLTASPDRIATHTIDVGSGAFDQVLPLPEQCFAHLDVTRHWYDDARPLGAVLVEETFTGSTPFDLPTGVHFATAELPAEIDEGHQAELLLEVPCVAVSGPPGALVEHALGLR
jgi:hypothetical protein